MGDKDFESCYAEFQNKAALSGKALIQLTTRADGRNITTALTVSIPITAFVLSSR